jgi:heme-degrading monooxygenase HmoA
MHARVAAFENPRFGDASIVDALTKRARESAPQWQEALRGAQGNLTLVDPDSGRGLGITFFGSEDEIRQAEPVFERMGDEVPEEERGRLTSVDVFEVGVQEVAGGDPRAARVSRLEGDPGKIDESTRRGREEFVPRLREIPGFLGAYSLHDRGSGRTVLVTLWESVEAMRSSEEQANRLRDQSAESAGGRVSAVERYQVAFAQLPARVGATG